LFNFLNKCSAFPTIPISTDCYFSAKPILKYPLKRSHKPVVEEAVKRASAMRPKEAGSFIKRRDGRDVTELNLCRAV
jgi:hypothetical protein